MHNREIVALFDIGSTLIDGPPCGPARRLSEMLALDKAAVAELEHILFRTPATSAEQLGRRIAEKLSLEEQRAVDACTTLWDAQLREAYVLPGAKDAIARLDAAKISRAYLSNIWAPFYEHFRQEFADEAVSCQQFLSFHAGVMKPDAEFFRQALWGLSAQPENVVMIGDTYKNDILPAIELGMRTVWVLHRPEKERTALVGVVNGTLPKPDLTLSSIGDLQPEQLLKIFERERVTETISK